jgi:hypothetical protein
MRPAVAFASVPLLILPLAAYATFVSSDDGRSEAHRILALEAADDSPRPNLDDSSLSRSLVVLAAAELPEVTEGYEHETKIFEATPPPPPPPSTSKTTSAAPPARDGSTGKRKQVSPVEPSTSVQPEAPAEQLPAPEQVAAAPDSAPESPGNPPSQGDSSSGGSAPSNDLPRDDGPPSGGPPDPGDDEPEPTETDPPTSTPPPSGDDGGGDPGGGGPGNGNGNGNGPGTNGNGNANGHDKKSGESSGGPPGQSKK